jgi:hypothetical protein
MPAPAWKRTLAVVLSSGCVYVSAADAGDERGNPMDVPPATVGETQGKKFAMNRYQTTWSRPSRMPDGKPVCLTLNEDGDPNPRTTIPIGPRRTGLKIRFTNEKGRPERVFATVWDSVGEDGLPVGRGEDADPRLYRARPENWGVKLRLPHSSEMFVRLLGEWPDRRECAPREANWTLRLQVESN